MSNPARISVQDARARTLSANPPLLVLGYEDDARFMLFHLEGAIPFSEFKSRLPSLPKDREIIFY